VSPRRQLTLATLGGAAAAGLVLLAASRGWAVQVTVPAAPLPPQTVTRTGAAVAPVVPALALVGFAGAGAVLATRGIGRAVVGVLVGLCGGGVAAGTWFALATVTGLNRFWPSVCLLGGLGLAVAGAVTVRRGAGWPGMGGAYERTGARAPFRSGRTGQEGTDEVAMWAAIDRGEDPTE
jgi:tryptophan-associated transmembrane protein